MARKAKFVLGLSLIMAFILLAYPFYVIRPFRYQGPDELRIALLMLRVRPFFETALAIIAAGCLLLSWSKGQGALRKSFLALGTLLVIACGFLARVNIYERMFHPLDSPRFAPASQTTLDGGEGVISVRMNNVARAYPIRSMSYHHIVNDTLGGVPIVATY